MAEGRKRVGFPADRTLIVYGGEVAAVLAHDEVYLLPAIGLLERDHPRRRYVGMMALVGREMQLGPDGEPYDVDLAQFYARAALIPDAEFVEADDGRDDAELAELFNVPLEQIDAKRYDLAFLRPVRPRKP